jgi:murein DD-endopeptidase MepM/ murein hydrolase activator NlpD
VTELAANLATARPARRVLRRGVIAGGVIMVLCLMCVGGTTLSLLGGLFGQTPANTLAFGCGNGKIVDPTGPMPAVSGLVEEQVRDAAIIVKVGQDMKVPARGWVIGIATALQESRLFNLGDLGARNDHDSIGLFQQRPSAGWGTPEQLRDPAYQARKFFEKLLTIANWQTLPLTVAAQRVQISAFPNAYAKHEPLASAIVDVLTGGASRSAVDVAAALQCAVAGQIAASGWTVPVKGPITSGFRPPSRPTHNGVDIGVPKGTAIHAATSGIVLVATCQAHVGTQAYSCDRDGGLFVSGCGWYVDILHAGNVITRYCHQMVRPYVTPGQSVAAGQVIGLSGASGNASGPHVHFEIHLDGDPGPRGAVDPIPYMNQVGAPLLSGA